jgi:hypothetical protein
MGLESVNYVVVPAVGVASAAQVIAALGAEERSQFPGREFSRWVLRNDQCWIDLMVGDLGPDAKPAISVRLAVTNPAGALAQLRAVLGTLLEHMPGKLFDKQTRRSYDRIDDDSWSEIEDSINKKRVEFQKNFGPFEAAISGEDVFPTLRSRN